MPRVDGVSPIIGCRPMKEENTYEHSCDQQDRKLKTNSRPLTFTFRGDYRARNFGENEAYAALKKNPKTLQFFGRALPIRRD
jgi:hypothetical protein